MQLSASRLSAGRASAGGPSLESLALAAIRRNGGSLWGVPASNAGLFTDSAGTTPATAVGDVLGLVNDQVGSNHATQPTTANKPVIAALPNGKRAMQFDGSNDLMNLGAGAVLSNAADHWACAAFIADAVGASLRVLYGCSSTASATPLVCQLFIDPRPRVAWRTDDNVNSGRPSGLGTSIVAGVPNVLTGARIGSMGYMWINGQLAWSGEITGSNSTVNTANIGATVRDTTTLYFAGKLATAAGQSTLAEADRRTIERYLAQQIGAQYLG